MRKRWGGMPKREATYANSIAQKVRHFYRQDRHGGAGMHEGYMAGYPASHGCVRMPAHMAEIFFHNVSTGTPVRVQP